MGMSFVRSQTCFRTTVTREMQTYTFSVCRQCRLALSREIHTSLPTSRSAKASKANAAHIVQTPRNQRKAQPVNRSPWLDRRPPNIRETLRKRSQSSGVPSPPSPEAIRKLLLRRLPSWTRSPDVIQRFAALGLEGEEIEALFRAYVPQITRKIKSETLTGEDPWSVSHILIENDVHVNMIVDRVLTMRFFVFASQPNLHIKGVRAESMSVLSQAHEALDLRYPAEFFPLARRMRRKVYLHVGPTNSGKTYNALRALAAARSGVYAGPLRLLAHEVWERLNRGSIRPHGTLPKDAHLYARQCNLITGEEQRIVSEQATLSSCTVEMINIVAHYNVCVIDEIQMIADPERGHAWTSALLGVSAEEVHLCGEVAVVPLITELMRSTGDQLEVKYYKRLTPLVVADKSLEGRWDRIQKGDCIVTFSRSSIFSLKRVVEEATGLRCAVAYGRLPPESRSEQATLFNAPDSGYDVMVATDAIGMGLNLKIKRVVFVQLSKFNGIRDVPLSLSQIKQIGGRAGRFEERGDPSSVGIVTCLNQNDLPTLTEAFAMQVPSLRRAYISLHMNVLLRMAQLLPPSFGLKALHSILAVACRMGDNYSLPSQGAKLLGMDVIDRIGGDLQLSEKMQFVMAPTVWRASMEFDIFVHFLRQFTNGQVVDINVALRDSSLLDMLRMVDEARSHHRGNNKIRGPATGYAVQTDATLTALEALHKVLVTYLWLSFRVPIWFSQRTYATKLKEDTEKGIEFVLEGMANMNELPAQMKTLQELREEASNTRIEYKPRKELGPMILRQANTA